MKTCSGCGEPKPLTDYGRDAQKRDGLTSRCLPCRRADCARYAATDAGRASQRKRGRRFAQANPEKVKAWTRAWRESHPDYSAEANRKWREANPGATAAYHRANRDKTMERVQRRRKRIKDAAAGPVDLDALWNGACGICHLTIDRDLLHPDPMSASVDHIFPLSKGGSHTQDNLQWTHLTCNLRKGNKEPAQPLAG